MSDGLITPGKKLYKPLVHPGTGKVLLPAGTVLTESYIERLTRQGLEQNILECLDAPTGEAAAMPSVADLDAFEIEIPALPDILAEFMAPAAPPPPAPAAAPAAAPAPAPVPAWVHPGMAPPGAVPAVPGAAPAYVPPGYAAPPGYPPAAPAAPPRPVPPPMRYYHNPAHPLPERAVMGAMQAIGQMEAQLKAGQMPTQDGLRRVIDEVLERLAKNAQNLNDGLEVRVVNQPHERSHPVNVFILSAVMGMALGYDQEQLRTLAIAALCHDIGKTAIPPEVLDKTSPLTPHEIELLRAHPLMGKRILEKMPWATPLTARIVYEHHERNDGSGYPLRLQEPQIHEMSKIVAIAEVYDALVSDTSYRARFAPELAYNAIRTGEKQGLDPRVIRGFLRYIVPYPLHAFVKLNSGEIAQVVQLNRQNPLRPVVKIGNAALDLAQSPKTIVSTHFQSF
ncbi:MAG TPA: HD-GYP domain-containing protein [Oscillatoriaceae cyanobacterium]